MIALSHTMKREILSLLTRWLFIIFLVILPLAYIGRKVFLLLNACYAEKSMCKQILILSAENELLKKRIDEYRIGSLLEAKARDDLGMIKPGEKVYFLRK